MPDIAGEAVRKLHHVTDDCDTRLTFSGMCPYCGFNPDHEETDVRWYCPRCEVQLDDALACFTCGGRYVRPRLS